MTIENIVLFINFLTIFLCGITVGISICLHDDLKGK